MRAIKLFVVLAPLLLISCHGAGVSPSTPASVGLQSHAAPPDIVQSGDGSQFIMADPISCCVTNLIAGPNGTIWYTDNPDNLLGRVDMAHHASTYPVPEGTRAEFISVGPGNLLWVTTIGESLPEAILRVTHSGGVTIFHARCASGTFNNIVNGPDGNVWIGVEQPIVLRMTLNGVATCFPTTGFTETVAAGPDGNVWFTEETSTGTLIGKSTPSGTVTEYPDPNVCRSSLVGAGDGFLYAGCSTGLVRISPSDGHEQLLGAVQPYSNLATAGTGDNAVLYYSVLPNHLRTRHLATGKVDDDDLPSGQSAPLSVAAGPDGNLWYFALQSGIGVDVLRILTASPLSLDLSVGQTQIVTASETNRPLRSLAARALNGRVATVVKGQSPGEFSVTGQAVGSNRIRITDQDRNHVDISVTLH
ncbi:MAG TPA: hypothetical protein VII69_03720 [Candidatus Eremiobacteraceae bacterium]